MWVLRVRSGRGPILRTARRGTISFEGLRVCLAAASASPPRPPPLVKPRALGVLYETEGRAVWVTRLPAVSVHRSLARPASSSCALRCSSRVSRDIPARRCCPGFLPWASFPHRGVIDRSPRDASSHARVVPPSTFLTSSTVSSSSRLRGFVSPRSHVQGSLFRGFSWRKAARARRPPLPSCRWTRLTARPRLQGLPPSASPLLHAGV
jgi:hypothetical protein